MRRKLVYLTAPGETSPWLAYAGGAHHGDVVDPDTSGATLEELADFCDGRAEAVNAHDFVGVHRLLAALLHRHFGRERATAVLRDVAELGGLDGMNGVCGQDDAFSELDVASSWMEWHLDDARSPADG